MPKPHRHKKPSRNPEPRVDYGPREAGQHTVMRVGPRVDPHGKTVMGARNVTQRPLDRYLAREQITPDQFSAGMRLYRAWYAAGRQPVVCGSYNQKIARGTGNAAEAKEIARQEYQRALKSLPALFAGVVEHVCLLGESAGAWAKATGRLETVGVYYLRDGLVLLADYYRAHKPIDSN